MKRDSNDKQWKEVKDKVYIRDNNTCRLCKVLTFREMLILRKKAGPLLKILDPAHFLPVSQRPDLCYETNNICVLNRYSHTMLDDYRNPLTGEYINKEEVLSWWGRILRGNENQYLFLKKEELI